MNKKTKQNSRIGLLLFMLIGFFNSAKATVAAYTFASSTGTYSSITGDTLFSGTWDDLNSNLRSMPFAFTYNGSVYTTLGVSSNGFITFGTTTNTVYCGLQQSPANSIAAYGTDLVNGSAASTVQTGTRGIAPNRQFVIQWTDADHYSSNPVPVNHWTFQIILNETSNTVQVVWGNSTDVTTMGPNACADAINESGDVGLLGNSTSDFNIRSVTNGTNTWATSVAGTSISNVCNMSSTNIPASGLTYTWTPGVPVPMSFVSCTTTFLNNGLTVAQNSTTNQVIRVEVTTTGSLSPFSITSLSLSTTGCTNPVTDITNAKVFFTGVVNTFSSSTQFGSTAVGPNGAFIVNGSATLGEGTNYLWITYDINASAGIGNSLTGCCTQITGTGTLGTRIPTTTCPAGSRIVTGPVGTWTQVNLFSPHPNGGVMLLLSDGSVMVKTSSGGASYGNLWDRLKPNINGSYTSGTWSTLDTMFNTRLYFSTQVLKDGRVYVAGGEYGTGLQQGEVYDPLIDTWTMTPTPGVNISDANSAILEDGRVLQALVASNLRITDIYNPATNAYSTGPACLGIHNESAWLKLPDNSILMVNRLDTTSERYIPSLNAWVADATVPVQLYDPYGDETGGALLLPDGRAFFIGSSGTTAYYTPSGTTSPGSWAAGPSIPGPLGAPDAPAAMMVNGKILCTLSPVPNSSDHFPSPTYFYEFDYLTNTFTLLNAPGGGTSLNISTYVTNMLDLPDGKVLYSRQGSTIYYVYTPAGSPLAAGKPSISNITPISCSLYKITGTKFNGISEGATYGDDWQMASNYPIVRLTSGSNVYYARTANWNSTGVQRGSSPDTAQFTLPAGLPAGTYSLVVVANGISSDPVSFTPSTTAALSSTLTPPAICTNTAFTYTPASNMSSATFTWTRAAVAGISNPAITTPQSANPNEVLINTTFNPVSVVYSYTINATGCSSNVQSVTVVVNPLPAASAITAGGPTTFCSGGNVLLSGNTTGGTWSIGGGTTATKTASSSGDYFVTTTNTCGSVTSNHILVTVNPLPLASTITAGGPTTFCSGGNVLLSGNSTGGTWSIGGGTTSTLSATTSGDYFVTTTNSCGSIASNHIVVTVNPLPTASTITAGGPTTFCSGGNVLLSGNSTGGTWSIGGGTTSTLSATTSGDYFVTTTNSCGSIASNHIVVTVNPLPTASTITAGGPTTFCSGGNVLLSGNSTGGTWSIGGATTSTLFATTSGDYFVTTTNSCGSIASNHIVVTVNPLPTASTITAGGPTTFCSGGNVLLSGNTTGGTWSIEGGTTSTLSATTSGDYFVTTTNSCGSIASNHIVVTVNPLPTASTITAGGPTTFCSGGNVLLSGNSTGGTWSIGGGTTSTLSATTSGDYFVTTTNSCGSIASNHIVVTVNPLPTASTITAGGPTTFCSGGNVLLSGNSTGGTWSIGGATTSTLSATTSGDYFVTTTNSCGSIESNHIIVTVNPLPVASIISAGGATSFCDGESLLLSGNTTGGTWSIGGGASATMSVTTSGDYFVTTTNSCGSIASNHIIVTVNPLPVASIISAGGATSFCDGESLLLSGNTTGGTWSIGGGTSATMSVTTSGDYFVTTINSCGSIESNHIIVTVNPLPVASIISAGGATSFCDGESLLLSGNTTGGTWSIGGGTTATLSATTNGDYFVTTNNLCGSIESNHIIVTVNPLPTASTITAEGSTTFCSGGNVLISGNSTGGTWSIGGGTSATMSVTTSGDYFVTTTNSCGSIESNHIIVTVNPLPVASIISAGGATSFCDGESLLLSGNTTGGTWSIGGGTSATMSVTTSGDYFVTTTNSCGSIESNHIIVTVNPLPTASTITAEGSTTFCSGGNVLLSGNSTGGTWSIGGGTSATWSATTSGDYFVTTTNSCGSIESNHIIVTVNPLPVASIISAGGATSFCDGESLLLSGNTTGGTWSIGGGTSATMSVTTSGDYFVTTTNSCGSIESNHIIVTVNPLPVASIISAGGATSFCDGESLLLSGNTTGGTWSIGGGTSATMSVTTSGDYFVTTTNSCGSIESNHIIVTVNPLPVASIISAGGATSFCDGESLLLSGNTTGGTWSIGGGTSATMSVTTSGDYFVTTTNSCGSIESNHFIVTVNPLPVASIISAGGATSFCDGESLLLSGNTTGGTWSIGGGTSATMSVTTSGDYFVTTTNSCGSIESNHIVVTVNTPVNWYLDADGDGYYIGIPVLACASPGLGYVTTVVGPNDCNDANPGIHPGAIELCNGMDDNCDGNIDEGCSLTTITLNLKLFIDGYYLGSNTMQPVLYNDNLSADPTACDTIAIELHGSNPPYSLVQKAKGLLHSDGTVGVSFQSTLGVSYYLAVQHQNTIETWSKDPVLFDTPVISFDFTSP